MHVFTMRSVLTTALGFAFPVHSLLEHIGQHPRAGLLLLSLPAEGFAFPVESLLEHNGQRPRAGFLLLSLPAEGVTLPCLSAAFPLQQRRFRSGKPLPARVGLGSQ